jgi:hypothetical protein
MRRKFGKMHFTVLMATLIIFMGIIIKGIPTLKLMEGDKNSVMEDKSKETVLYSSLNFGETPSRLKPYDEISEETTMDTIPFSEDILGEADIVCKATVINTYKESLCYCENQTDVYEVGIDKIYYSEEKVKEGEIIKIVNFDFFNNHIAPLNSEILKDHQYIFPIRNSIVGRTDNGQLGGGIPESEYGIVYPYVNQIEVTKNNEYVFHGGWKSLINENTVDVILDGEKDNTGEVFYMNQIKLRRYEGFEDDLKALIQKYKDKKQDVMGKVWNQLDVKDIEFVREDSTIHKIILNDKPGTRISDSNYMGKEVYIIDFLTTMKSMPNNRIVYASIDDYKIIGYGLVD